jgi:hypothetical protein
MHFTEALLRGIADTLSWRVIRSALMTGIPLALLWLGIGYLLWQPVTGVTATVIGWVPFSILKANGAFLLAGFVWFTAVLVTFALIVALFHVPIMKFVPEERFEHFSMLLLLLISLAWTLFIFLNWDFVYGEVMKVLTWFPFQTLQEGVALMLGALFFYNLFIVSMALVVLLYHKPFLHALQKDDYPAATLAQEYKGRHFLPIALRDAVMFLILLILFFPLFFVPFINILIQVFFWAWLIKDSYFQAAASLYASDEEIKMLKKHQLVLWGIAFVTSMLNILPVVNILAPFFALIVYFHWTMLNRPHLPVPVTIPEAAE